MNWFNKKHDSSTEPVDPIVVTTVRRDSVLHRMVTEADIRQEAYLLWEKSGKVGSSEEYWYRAEKKIREALLAQK